MNGMRSQSGNGKLGTIVGILLLLFAIVVAVKWIPVRVKVYDLQDTAESQAERLGLQQIKPEQVQESLLQKARDLQLPVKNDDIEIINGSSSWYIELKYTVPVDFIVYTWDWKIDQRVEGVKISM